MKGSIKITETISPRKYALLTGTLLLTGTGFITRVLGFFYRIFLSRTIGAEGLGLFNMLHPVFGICFALCAGSIQTAISQCVASNTKKGRLIFRTGIFISLSISFILAFIIIRYADIIGEHILLEPRCTPLLSYIAISIPCAAVHACINGYYYGMHQTKVPAFAQVIEQTIRIGAVFLIADIMMQSGIVITVQLAIIGHLIGEISASLYTIISFQFFPPDRNLETKKRTKDTFRLIAPMLMGIALPLMGNRLILNILASAEAIWIPSRLTQSGLSTSDAYSVYGVLTGMALPFILFPSTLFNSLAVLLLPTVAEAQSDGNTERISNTITMSIRYSMYIGILCIGIFTLFGNDLGVSVFKDKNAGSYITILAWLCPFIYLVTTLGSILNGLGKTTTTFFLNITALLIRISFVLFGIPKLGIKAYLIGMLVSELLLALLHLFVLKRQIAFHWNVWEMIIKPSIFLLISIGIYRFVLSIFSVPLLLPMFFITAFHIFFLCLCYGGLLLLFHVGRNVFPE